MPFYNWNEIPNHDRPGNRVLRMVSSDHAVVLRVEHVGPAAHEPHIHEESEQISSLLEGEMEFTLGEEVRVVRPGDIVVVPAGLLHGTRVPAGVRTVALEFFSPPRPD